MRLLVLSFLTLVSAGLRSQNPGGIFETGPQALHQKIYPVSTLVNGDYVISFGGRQNGFVSSSYVDVYNPFDNVMLDTPMNYPHDSHTVVKLNESDYLIIGGSYDLGVPAYSSCEKYSSVSGLFTPAGNMVHPRMQTGAALLEDGRVLIVGGWYDDTAASVPEICDPQLDSYSLTGSLNVPRAQAVVIPTSDGGAVIAGGWSTYGTVTYTSYEYFDPVSNNFSIESEELVEGEEGWKILAPWTRPISDCKLNNGHYVFLSYKTGTPTEYTLLDFDPVSKSFSQMPLQSSLTSEFTDGGFTDIVIDRDNERIYLIGFDSGYDPQRVALVTVDVNTGTVYSPTAAFELPANEYFYASYTWMPNQGKIFVHGINASSSSYFNGTEKTYLITPNPEVGVYDAESLENDIWKIYPNPATENVLIQISDAHAKDVELRIVDVSGRLIKTLGFPKGSFGQSQVLSLYGMSPGLYTIVLYSEDRVSSKRLLVE